MIHIYPQPPELERSPDFRLFVGDEEVPVLQSAEGAFACFGIGAAADVRVEMLFGQPHHATYRPLARGRMLDLHEKTLSFQLPGPEQCVLHIDRHKTLFLFADSLEASEPPGDPGNWLVFDPGKIHDIGRLELKPGQSCWIPGGAVVRGSLLAHDQENFTIRGPGILLGDFQPALGPAGVLDGRLRPTLQLAACRQVAVRDLLILDSRAWTTVLAACQSISLSNHKVLSSSICDDGLDIVGCRDITVEDSFICSRDDCVAVKASNYSPFLAVDGALDVGGIRVERCIFVNADCGNALEIGFELKTRSVRDICFRDCDILRCEAEGNRSGAAMSIHCGNWAKVEDVVFQDIRVEQAMEKLVDICIFHSPYDADPRQGHVENILFENIQLFGGILPRSFIEGCGDNHRVKNVRLRNFRMTGASCRTVLNRCFGIPCLAPAWPNLPLEHGLRETFVLKYAENVQIEGKKLDAD
jgi:hypothetical protein